LVHVPACQLHGAPSFATLTQKPFDTTMSHVKVSGETPAAMCWAVMGCLAVHIAPLTEFNHWHATAASQSA
jgi:hypothetical protein